MRPRVCRVWGAYRLCRRVCGVFSWGGPAGESITQICMISVTNSSRPDTTLYLIHGATLRALDSLSPPFRLIESFAFVAASGLDMPRGHGERPHDLV